MTSIVVRGLDESVKRELVARAKRHGRSMEAEVRDILTQATSGPNIAIALLRAVRETGGGEDLPIPTRAETAGFVDFS